MDITNKIPINIGLFGHIDTGKTAIAKELSEIISTAGIDAHPQSKERGITIDLGFTSFILDNYLITLVDAPGHADLIKISASSVEIIDLALVVVDITKGPQIQTGEHLIMIESLNIENIVVVLNKIDLFRGDIDSELNKMREFFKSTTFGSNIPIFTVSAKNKIGFKQLKEGIYKIIEKLHLKRDYMDDLIIPIDHYFNLKGKGTIITGTIVSGKIKSNQEISILPIKKKGRVKNIEIFRQITETAQAGHRVGINLKNIDTRQIYRGCYLTDNPKAFEFTDIVEIHVKKTKLFKYDIKFGTQIHITIGMITKAGKIYPYKEIEGKKVKTQISVDDTEFNAILLLNEKILIRKKRNIMLLSRLDLPPTTLRILGASRLIEIHDKTPLFYKYKKKTGRITNIDHPQGYICTGLAQSLIGARKILGKKLESPFTKILDTFGTKGSVIVGIENNTLNINVNDPVILKELRNFHAN